MKKKNMYRAINLITVITLGISVQLYGQTNHFYGDNYGGAIINDYDGLNNQIKKRKPKEILHFKENEGGKMLVYHKSTMIP